MKLTLLGGVKQKVLNLTTKVKNYSKTNKLVALSMVFRITGLILLLSLFPLNNYKPVNAISETKLTDPVIYELQFNVQNYRPITLEKIQTAKIELGESNYDKTQREKAENDVMLAYDRDVYTREIDRSEPAPADADLATKRALVKKAAAKYNIDWKILEAVWQVESGKSWDTSTSSSAGAQGPMQFMPGTWAAYGQDGNGDGVSDINKAEDALYGGANYLAAGGASSGNVDQALFNYNHAQWYVDMVKGVANSITE